MKKGKKLKGQLNDGEIDEISKFQRFTYRCIKMFNPNIDEYYVKRNNEEKMTLMNRWASKIFQDSNIEIVFDETIWPPDDSDSVGNVVRLEASSKLPGYTAIEIDFRKGFHNCVSFYTGETKTKVDIFNVQYTQ